MAELLDYSVDSNPRWNKLRGLLTRFMCGLLPEIQICVFIGI